MPERLAAKAVVIRRYDVGTGRPTKDDRNDGPAILLQLGRDVVDDRMTWLIGERLVGTINVNTSVSAGGTSSTTAYSEDKRALIDASELTALGKIEVPKKQREPEGLCDLP